MLIIPTWSFFLSLVPLLVGHAKIRPHVQGTITVLLSAVFAAAKGQLITRVYSSLPGVEVGQGQEFAIDTKGAGGQGKLDVTISSPSRKIVPCLVAPVAGRESSTAKFIPREEGLYAVDVTYDGHPVPGSPYTVEASLPPDPTKVSFGFCTRTLSPVVQYTTVVLH